MYLNQVGTQPGKVSMEVAKSNALESNTDMFLTLLLEQIKNQDPTNPQDPAESLSQLTQLSQLETTGQISTSIADIGKQIDGIAMIGLIGREVALVGGDFSVVQRVALSDGEMLGYLADGGQFLSNEIRAIR